MTKKRDLDCYAWRLSSGILMEPRRLKTSLLRVLAARAQELTDRRTKDEAIRDLADSAIVLLDER